MTLTDATTRPDTADRTGTVRSWSRRLAHDSLFRNSAFLLLGTIELAAGGFLFWQVVAHLFTTADVGRASALVSASTLIANLALLGMNNSLIRYLNTWPDRAATANTALVVVSVAAALGAAGFVAGSRWFAPQLGLLRRPADAALFVLFTAVLAASMLNDSVFIALRRSGYILSRNTVMVLVRTALPFACVTLGAFGVFTAYQAAIALALPVYLIMLRRRFGMPTRLRARGDRLAAMWRYSAGNYIATAILMLPTLAMPVLVAQRVGPADAAYYYIAAMLASALTFVPQATTRSFFAEATHDIDRLRASLRKVIRLTVIAQTPILLILVAAGPFLLGLFGSEYAGAYPVLVVLAICGALTSVGFIGSTLLMLTGRLRLMCGISAVGCAVSLAGSYLLVGRGLVWVGWSLAAGELILCVSYIVLVVRMLRTADSRQRTRSSKRAFLSRLAAAGSEHWRRQVIRRAVDATDVMTVRRTLVIAPHPDDETFGAGATISRCTAAGTPVTIVVATDGRGSTRSAVLTPQQLAVIRATEMAEASRILGVGEQDLVWLGFQDGTLRDNFPRLVGKLRALLRVHLPEQVLVPCMQDDHPDHRTVHRALRQAVDDVGIDCVVIAYPVGTWMNAPWFVNVPPVMQLGLLGWATRQLFPGRRPVAVSTAGHLHTKRAALRAHASQTTNLTGEPTWQYFRPAHCSPFLGDAEIFLPIP
jgi:LmbE family N-acetylglucosaminyl deacetylase/O-antigen/teichoic acid export membrane protein